MIPRYQNNDISAIWADASKYGAWMQVELATVNFHDEWTPDVVESLMRTEWFSTYFSVDATATESKFRGRWTASEAMVDLALSAERATSHDVVAFLKAVKDSWEAFYKDRPTRRPVLAGDAIDRLHYALTSSDVVDTANAILIQHSENVISQCVRQLVDALDQLCESRGTLEMVGRTHGQAAVRVALGQRLTRYASLLEEVARPSVTFLAKMGGPTGTEIPRRTAQDVLTILGLGPQSRGISQCAPRVHIYSHFAQRLTLAMVCEQIATDFRLLAISEVGEVSEGFGAEQVGSSCMPHKRNPITCEKICGLVRVLKGHVSTLMHDTPLWLERDISHSSAERIVYADFYHLLGHVLLQTSEVVKNLVIHESQVSANLTAAADKLTTYSKLHTAIDDGKERFGEHARLSRQHGGGVGF